MTFTHEELLSAVREAGRDRESFTCADVRGCLGLSTKDRRQLSRFHAQFRAFQKQAGDEIEKVANNCYRLNKRVSKRARAASKPSASVVAMNSVPEQTIGELPAVIELKAAAPVLEATHETLELPVAMLEAPASPMEMLELPDEMLEAAIEELELSLEARDTAGEKLAASADTQHDTLETETLAALADMQHDTHDALELTDAIIESSVELSDDDSDELSEASVTGRFGSELLPPAVRRWRDRGQWLGRRVVEMFSRA
jgi:hypothetical protein